MSGCECDDLPRFPVWEERTPKARKEHTCAECNGPIKVGEVHHYYFAVDEEKRADRWRVCNQCEADWGLLQCYLSDECGRIHGQFSDCLDKALEQSMLDDVLQRELLDDSVDRRKPQQGEEPKAQRPVCAMLVRWIEKEGLADWIQVSLESRSELSSTKDMPERLEQEYRNPREPQPFLELVTEYLGGDKLAGVLNWLDLLSDEELPSIDAPGQLFLFEEGAP